MESLERVNNTIRIPVSSKEKFFRAWTEFLAPLHNLTSREQDVLASLLKNRFELEELIKDESLLDKYLLSDDIKTKVKEECKISDAFFQVILGKLRKTGIIVNDKIYPRLIPKQLHKEDNFFTLLLFFEFNVENP